MITKEITHTTVKLAQLEMVDGEIKGVALPDETILGNVNAEKAQKEIRKIKGDNITVMGVQANTFTYELPVEVFLQHATLKVDKVDQPEEEAQA